MVLNCINETTNNNDDDNDDIASTTSTENEKPFIGVRAQRMNGGRFGTQRLMVGPNGNELPAESNYGYRNAGKSWPLYLFFEIVQCFSSKIK
jgi:hypothetical protein